MGHMLPFRPQLTSSSTFVTMNSAPSLPRTSRSSRPPEGAAADVEGTAADDDEGAEEDAARSSGARRAQVEARNDVAAEKAGTRNARANMAVSRNVAKKECTRCCSMQQRNKIIKVYYKTFYFFLSIRVQS